MQNEQKNPRDFTESAGNALEIVARIVYASQARIQGSVYAEMERIRACAVRHNEPAGIHTALLYQSGCFVQWTEGPGDALLRLMDHVSGDRRHEGMRIVHSSRGPRLLAGPWSMAIVQCNDSPVEMMARVNRLREMMEAGTQCSPPAAWRQLSTPMRHPGAAQQADPDAFQRILVCSSWANESFELVDWLARRTRQEVVHRRFAGAKDLDVGTDLVDFQEEGRVMRVIAMARKGLTLSLTRAFLPDYAHLMLLLCGEREHDLALLHRVAEACAGLASPPLLLGVAQDDATHNEAFAIAHHLGLIYLKCDARPDSPAEAWSAAFPVLSLARDAANSGYPAATPQRVGS
ncbi:MAG: BLUF domain-containing protein [Ramlibacter sp.]